MVSPVNAIERKNENKIAAEPKLQKKRLGWELGPFPNKLFRGKGRGGKKTGVASPTFRLKAAKSI